MKIQKQRKSVVEMARRFKKRTSCLKVLACTRCPWEDVSLKTVRCPRWRIFENRSLILSSKISPSKTGAALNQSVIRSTTAASFTAERRGFYDWVFFFFSLFDLSLQCSEHYGNESGQVRRGKACKKRKCNYSN